MSWEKKERKLRESSVRGEEYEFWDAPQWQVNGEREI